MALLKFLRILAVVSLLHASFDALPVNALAVERAHVGRALGHAHADIAKKRDSSKKCRPRPSSASLSPVATTTSPPYSVSSSNPSQPAHTTTSSQSPSTSTTPSSSGGSKILIAWNNNENKCIKNFVNNNWHDIYNWKRVPYNSGDLGPSLNAFEQLNFIPTIWGRDDANNVADILKLNRAKMIIKGFNEPELSSQAGISPEEGYTLWSKHVAPLANLGHTLIAPAVTTSPLGKAWLTSWLNLCNGNCRISALDLHHYSISPQEFTTVVNDFHGTFNKQIWVTEVGCHDYYKGEPCTQSVFDAFYSGVMSFALSQPFIEKVAWFGFFEAGEIPNGVEDVNRMIDSSTCGPNALGNKFIYS